MITNRSECANSHSTIFPAIPPTVPAAKSAMALRRAGEETKFPEKESAFDASELISVALSELNDKVDTLDRTPLFLRVLPTACSHARSCTNWSESTSKSGGKFLARGA